MAYGDGYLPEELEHTEILFRCRDLVNEWFKAFRDLVLAPDGNDVAERMALEWAERRLEETALDLSLHLKARRLEREGRLELPGPQKREEGAA